jgi:hypothetical protein
MPRKFPMKFPKFQHERIMDIIESNGLEMKDVFLVKRKGWIRIEHLQSDSFFTYFKKKETIIDPDTKEWLNKVYFKVKTDKTKTIVSPTFDALMGLFEAWVKNLL